MIQTGFLPDPEAQSFWPDLVSLLDMAAKRGGIPAWSEGDWAWIAIDGGEVIGAATTRLMTDGQAELKLVAGTRWREWYPQMEAQICDWARNAGAGTIVAEGRKGWVPLVTRLGWQVVGTSDGRTLFEKELLGGRVKTNQHLD